MSFRPRAVQPQGTPGRLSQVLRAGYSRAQLDEPTETDIDDFVPYDRFDPFELDDEDEDLETIGQDVDGPMHDKYKDAKYKALKKLGSDKQPKVHRPIGGWQDIRLIRPWLAEQNTIPTLSWLLPPGGVGAKSGKLEDRRKGKDKIELTHDAFQGQGYPKRTVTMVKYKQVVPLLPSGYPHVEVMFYDGSTIVSWIRLKSKFTKAQLKDETDPLFSAFYIDDPNIMLQSADIKPIDGTLLYLYAALVAGMSGLVRADLYDKAFERKPKT